MIEKMEFISIIGPKGDIDRVVEDYLTKYEIHLESALAELSSVQTLSPYMEINPYRELLSKAKEFEDLLEPEMMENAPSISLEAAIDTIKQFDEKFTNFIEKQKELEEKENYYLDLLKKLEPFRSLNFDISQVLNYRYLNCHFGRISKDFYSKFETYVYKNMDTLFYQCYSDENYIWGTYFCPRSQEDRVEAVYTSMHFEEIELPSEIAGEPETIYKTLNGQLNEITKELNALKKQMLSLTNGQGSRLYAAEKRLEDQSRNFDIRKLAACTRQDHREVYYILCGWMTAKDSAAFQKAISNDKNICCFVENDDSTTHGEPPTKLKNPKIFRPFETFIKMYGLPSYREMDPTIFVALTYIFIFGAMFGDAGQGLCLFVGGLLLYKFKKIDLAAIISLAGIFSTFFGVMFGSFFGFENIIPALWLHPLSAMADVPFLGKLNTVFVVSIAFGVCLILLTMILHIINAIRQKDLENVWFDQNAVSGLVFYGSLAAVIVLFLTGHKLPAGIVLGIMFGIPLLLIMLKEPLTRLIKKETPAIEGGKGMYLVQSIFELFEVLLSYMSNTLSFVRIGAFAVSHAAMMEVVLMLAGAETGSPNWLIVVLGNIFVTAMEGLIVGIQVLRLEYYEMFSRFYKGNGKPFKPFLRKNK